MAFIGESQAKGTSKRVVRELLETVDPEADSIESNDLMSMPPKKRAREIIRLCKRKSSRFVFLEDRYREKTRWEVMWGEWSLGYRGVATPESYNQYDRLYFDLIYSRKSSMHLKFFYIVISKHALIRMIMRSRTSIVNSKDAFVFLRTLTRDSVFAGMSLLEGSAGNILVSNGFYLPLVKEEGLNLYGKKAISIVVKTVMPKHFSVNPSDLIDRTCFRPSLFDCSDCFPVDKR